MLGKLYIGILTLLCVLAVGAGLIYALMWAMLDRSPPKNYPDDWGAYVWVSEDPKAFITNGYKGIRGGQMEINGEICNIKTRTWPGDCKIDFEIDTYIVSLQTGHITSATKNPPVIYTNSTKYKTDSIVCKVSRESEYFPGQKIVFTKYAKDEVSPADFAFEIEDWDGFVTVVDSIDGDKREERPERAPCPTPTAIPETAPYPIQTPVPISTPAPMPEYALVTVAGSRERRAGE